MSNDKIRYVSRGVSKNSSKTNKNISKIKDLNQLELFSDFCNKEFSSESVKNVSGNLVESSAKTSKPADETKKLPSFDVLDSMSGKSRSTPKTTPKPSLFQRFCQDPNVSNQLIEDGRIWLEIISSQSISYLNLNNRWTYINKKKKAGYKASLSRTVDGVPQLKLQYHDFSNGGFRDYFESAKSLKSIYQDWKFYNFPISLNVNKNLDKRHNIDAVGQQLHQRTNRETYLKSLAGLRESRLAKQAIDEAKEAVAKEASLAKDNLLWESLASTGQSKYLIDKFLGSIQSQAIDSIRYGNGFIMAKITSLDGQTKGYQFISDDGRKKFGYGLEKTNSLIVLGKLPKKPRLIYVVEGLATGLSIRLARPDVVVICALDVGNIIPVIKQLRAFGSPRKCKIIILADNDQWKANEINPRTNKAIGNAGLITANKAALKYRCLVAKPTFDKLNLDIIAKPTDFNDLHKVAGIDEVKRQLKLATKADPEFAYSKAYESEKTRLHNLFSNTGVGVKHKVITVNDTYLKDFIDDESSTIEPLIEAMGEQAVTLLRSGMGSGKTELIRNFIKSQPELTSIYISPRISLCGNAAARLDSEFYLDYKQRINKEEIQTVDHLAIVVNSLAMLISQDGVLRHFDIIVLDEIEQLFRHLLTKINNKKLVLECFYSLIRQAKYIVVGDAHLGNTTLDFLSELRPKEKFLTVLNHYQVGKGKEVVLYQEAGNLEIAALCELFRGGKAYVAFNCKKRARAFYELVKEFYKDIPTAPKLEALYISSDTSGEAAVKEFFSNPNAEAIKYNLIISTPALSSGVSIDIEHFSFVGGVFSHTVNTPLDCQQALARVRKANLWHVYVSDAKQSLPTDEQTISAKWKESHPFDQYHLMKYLGNDTFYGFNDPIYEGLCLNVERNRAFLVNDFLGNFTRELVIAGFEIKYKINDEIQDFAASYFTNTGKKLELKRYIKDLVEAKNISVLEAQTITQKGNITLEEKHRKDKYDIKLAYRLDDDVNDNDLTFFIEKDERGELRKKISRLEVAMSSDFYLLKRYEQQESTGINLAPDMRLFWSERLLFSKLLNVLGIDNKSLQYNGLVYSKEYIRETGFINWVEENRKELSGIVSVPKSEQLEKDPLRFISKLLKLIGLKQTRIGRASKGTYMICTQQLAFIRQIIAKRAMASLVVGIDEIDQNDDLVI